MDLTVRIKTFNVWVWGSGRWVRDVAEVEDEVGLGFGPSGDVGGEVWACEVVGFVGGGHGVAAVWIVFEMHFGGSCCGWCAGGRHLRQLGGFMCVSESDGETDCRWGGCVLKCLHWCL